MAVSTATYPAKVTFNADPDKRGVIRVACIGLMGDEETECPVDVEPVHDWGWFVVPDVGEIVEIEVLEGSDEDEQAGQMSIDNLDLKWRSARYYGNEEGDTPTPIHAAFTSKNYGKRRGFATPAGHVMMFDDTEGQEEITLSWKDGSTLITMNKSGSILLQNKKGAHVNLDCDSDKIIIEAPAIEVVGGATEHAIFGDLFKTFFDAHTHTAPMGITSPPNQPMPASTLSEKVTIG